MKPVLLNYALQVKQEPEVIFDYNYELSLNTIKIKGSEKPFVDMNENDIAYLTKTKVAREREDNDINRLDYGRKTEVRREKDTDYLCLLQLQTKTFVKKEQDE